MAMRWTGPLPFCCTYTGTVPEQEAATPDSCPCILTVLETPQFVCRFVVPELCVRMLEAERRLGVSLDLWPKNRCSGSINVSGQGTGRC